VSYSIFWEPVASSAAARFLADDPEGLRQVFGAIDLLADDPRPDGAAKWGSPDRLRIHVGFYRVLYEIRDTTITIAVLHLGRLG
jgi:mRNA interferase RelE/StbE